AAAGVAGQRERDGAAIDVGRGRGDPDGVAGGGAFRNAAAGRAVAIGRRRGRHVGDRNGEGLGGERTAGVGRLDGDGVAGRGLVVVQRGPRPALFPYTTLFRSAAAGVAGQRERDGAAIDVGRGRGDPD